MDNSLNIQPPQKIYNVFKHLNYRYWYALAEFVDNSIESYLTNKKSLKKSKKDYKLKIEIVIDVEKKEITIKDNAAGISEKEMERAFTPAVEPTGKGLSEFGMGMKAAGCWFCDFWTVRTKHSNENFENIIKFDLKKIIAKNITSLSYDNKVINNNKSYTIITLKKVSQFPHTNSIKKIKDYLTNIYRIFLRENEIEILLNNEKLEYRENKDLLFAPFYTKIDKIVNKLFSEKEILEYTFEELEDLSLETLHKYNKNIHKEDYRIWKQEIDFQFYGKTVKGFVGLLKTQSPLKSGLFLIRNKRIIVSGGYKPEEIFKLPNSQEYQRIFGELSVDGFKVTHTKDNINWEGKEDEFIRKLHSELKKDNFLKQANKYRKNLIENKRKKLMEKYTEELERQKEKAEEEEEKRKAAEEKAEEEKRKAEEEEEKRKTAEEETKRANEKAKEEEEKRKTAEKKFYFEKGTDLNKEKFLEILHSIKIYSSKNKNTIDLISQKFAHVLDLKPKISNLKLNNDTVLLISEVATGANFNFLSKKMDYKLIDFFTDYIKNYYEGINRDVSIDIKIVGKEIIYYFSPLDFMILFDNFYQNSKNAKANKIIITFENKKDAFVITFEDNGKGIAKENLEEIFQIGFTTTSGSGIGMHHIKKILNSYGAVISIDTKKNTKFIMVFKK